MTEDCPSPACPSSRTDCPSVHSLPPAHQPAAPMGPLGCAPGGAEPSLQGQLWEADETGRWGACLFLTRKRVSTRPRKEGLLCGRRGPPGLPMGSGECVTLARPAVSLPVCKHSALPLVGAGRVRSGAEAGCCRAAELTVMASPRGHQRALLRQCAQPGQPRTVPTPERTAGGVSPVACEARAAKGPRKA